MVGDGGCGSFRSPGGLLARLVSAAIVAASFVLPRVGVAQVSRLDLCVTDTGLPNVACSSCDAAVTSLEEAFDLAVATPGPLGGQRPEVSICLQTESGVHTESIVVDNLDGRIGAPLSVNVVTTALCPAPGADENSPVLQIVNSSGTGDAYHGVVIDFSANGSCPSSPNPGLDVSGEGHPFVFAEIDGTSTFAVGNGVLGPPAVLSFSGNIMNCGGAALRTSGMTFLHNTEVAGCVCDGSEGAVGLLHTEADGELAVLRSSFFGNQIDGSAGTVEGLIAGRVLALTRVTFVANAVSGGAALVHSEWPVFNTVPGSSAFDSGFASHLVVARNRQVMDFAGFELPHMEPSAFGTEGVPSCFGLAAPAPYSTRANPFGGLVEGDGPLLRVEGPQAGALSHRLGIFRSFFVQNEIGSAALISTDAAVASPQIDLIHNTVADNGQATLMSMDAAAPATMLVSARNLFIESLGNVPTAPMVQLPSYVRSVTSTMNVAPAGVSWVTPGWGTMFEVTGPDVTFSSSEFVDSGWLRALAPCMRFQQVCPASAAADCPQGPWPDVPCAVDAAVEYVPTPAFVAALGTPWPWDTGFFEPSYSQGGDAPGATGWSCSPPWNPLDRYLELRITPLGDGDGAPDLLDCDNDDASLVPSLPDYDGYSSVECAPGTCFVCPEGSIPVGDDDSSVGDDDSAAGDDDSGMGDDDTNVGDDDSHPGDDDSATGDDDSASGDDDTASGDDDSAAGGGAEGDGGLQHSLSEGCSAQGVGAAYYCSATAGNDVPGALSLVALVAGARRRRRSR